MTFDAAFSFVQKRRPVIFPNFGFQNQLRKWEEYLSREKRPTKIDLKP